MPKTASDYIREELTEDFGRNVHTVCENVRKKSGLIVKPQSVYAVRSNLRKNPKNLPKLTLEEQVIAALKKSPQGLTAKQLVVAVHRAGYVSASANFAEVLRQMLVKLTNRGTITKNGSQYQYAERTVSAVPVSETAETASSAIIQSGEFSPSKQDELRALWESAIISSDQPEKLQEEANRLATTTVLNVLKDLAKSLNLPDPDGFSLKLLQARRTVEIARLRLEDAEKKYQEVLKNLI